MDNVIVTGGTGFLGRNMINTLCKKGYRVFAIVRPDSRNIDKLPKDENVIPVFCELNKMAECGQLEKKSYDAFYHFAWGGVNREEIDDESVQYRSLEDSLGVLDAAIKLGCKCFVFSGSRSEYGSVSCLFSEDLNCDPLVAYGRAKMEFGNRARELCKGTDIHFIHCRIFSVYGADDHPWSLIYTAVSKMLRNEAMDLSPCTQLWNYMEVRDMADLLLAFHEHHDLIPSDDSGIFNVATSDIRPLKEFVEEIYRITGSKSELRFGAFHQNRESAISIVPDMSKVERIFGWSQKISFEDGIRDLVSSMGVSNA